ncbi:MAG: protein-export membrane protein SecD [Elusimicrobia bacterium GWA2_56_46]|nr:MAG: protein-export membrane protein SecD [Elusimicrobia bacterium GWA2_56_46]OGR54428.1 MAG: protein-export membrane protein SecD [Elusimicrobia bacterium GWC2_56_31]HBW22595.1 protein translocase subunit SecD [Elusimicrobiota bacterium]
MNKLHWKLGLVLGLVILSVWLLYPTVEWYTKTADERGKLEAVQMRPKRMLNLGLDLRGGTHMLLELDVEKLDKKENLNDALARAIEILRNRIDQYGVGETPISRQGERWISVDLPGISNTEEAENLIGKTALLEFRLVDTSAEAEKALTKVADLAESPFGKDGALLPEIAKLMPRNTGLFRAAPEEEGARTKYYVLSSSVGITGAYLENARVSTDEQFGYPNISFTFNKEGGKIFERYTGDNVGKYLAIVLDGVVHSAPVIKSRIGGGSGEITGSFTMEVARNLAIILRAGALPAPVRIIEKRVVGPDLGEDSIKKGVTASLIGFLCVVVFMVTYYRAGGLVANIALGLNFVLLMAAMSYFSATLTLPGIAGMILSLAMAIDANVLILERMREELALSKPIPMLIPTAYEKAWTAILDSNVTTWIAAVFLFQFGSGPVKGFAVTLTIGLLAGMFTSVFVTRAIYEFWLTSNPKELSI